MTSFRSPGSKIAKYSKSTHENCLSLSNLSDVFSKRKSRKRSLKVLGIPSILVDEPQNETEDVFVDNISSAYFQRNKRLLPSFSSSPLCLPLVNSPGRKELQNFGLNSLQNIQILGKGSFGTVILGNYQGKRVAVKVIPEVQSRINKCLESEFNAELLNHENIVKIHGVYSNRGGRGNTVILMEYVGKSNLQRILDDNLRVLNKEFIGRCLNDLCSALLHCHSKGVLHLDVKPSNVFVSSLGVCKLGDFGCSHLSGSNSESGNLVGTPGYQAPEFLMNHIPTEKCDVFSFSILMWQIINHKSNPYAGFHPHTIVFKVVSQDYRPSDESILDSHYEQYRSIYRKGWAGDPKRRLSMNEVHIGLTSILYRQNSSSSISIRI